MLAKVSLGGPMNSAGPDVSKLVPHLMSSWHLSKPGGLRGSHKEVSGSVRGYQVPNVVLGGTNELPWPRCFQIGATLDALLPFLKSGGLKGHLKEVSRGPRSAAVPYGEADYLICFVLKIRWPLLVCPLSVLPIPALYVPLLINKKKSVVYVPKKNCFPFCFYYDFWQWAGEVGKKSSSQNYHPRPTFDIVLNTTWKVISC